MNYTFFSIMAGGKSLRIMLLLDGSRYIIHSLDRCTVDMQSRDFLTFLPDFSFYLPTDIRHY